MSIQRLYSISIVLTALVAVFTHSGAASAINADPIAKISLQAKLFNAKSGTLSADVLAPGAPELFNVVARDDPSTSSLVLVAVALADGKVLPSDARVRLVARERASRGARARTVVDKTIPLGAVSQGGTTHMVFWLPDVGCRAVDLKATLTVARQRISLAANSVIPFACNE